MATVPGNEVDGRSQNRADVIPEELRSRPQWLTWFLDNGNKIPNGKSNDASTWRSFDEVSLFDRIAYVFSADDPYVGIDLDSCRDAQTGDIKPWAMAIIRAIGSYCEVSPSGTGVKIILRGKKPAGSRCQYNTGEVGTVDTKLAQVEIYDNKRFWCITGQALPGFENIREAQNELNEVIEFLVARCKQKEQPKPKASQFTSKFTSTNGLVDRARAYVSNSDNVSQGGRDNAAFSLAGNLAAFVGTNGERLSESEITELVRGWNDKNTPPMHDYEIERCVKSALTNGTPRDDKRPTSYGTGNTSTNGTKSKQSERRQLPILSAANFAQQYQGSDPPLIEGLLRIGETMNVIASPKIGKTWLVAGIALSIANGLDWMGYQCTSGKVLVLDFELRPKTLRERYETVSNNMNAPRDNLDLCSLRGDGRSIIELGADIRESVKGGEYVVIIWDALYRTLPKGVSENDNAAMMAIYNELDAIAAHAGASNVVIHHSSKGNQSEKSVTDVGSGAGSISRAADTHLTIRPHELADCAVVDAVCRSYRSPAPMTIRWEYPLWSSSEIEPAIKQAKGGNVKAQEANDRETIKAISDALGTKWRTVTEIRNATGFGDSRVRRGLSKLKAKTRKVKSKKTRKGIEIFAMPENGTL
jgi:hypothetical protein